MKNLKNLKKLADMHFEQYEHAMAVIAAETAKAKTSNYLERINYAKQSANAEQEYENINYELQGFENNVNPFEEIEENVQQLKPKQTVSRHITMVERLQMDKANGIICSPIIEDIECVMYEE